MKALMPTQRCSSIFTLTIYITTFITTTSGFQYHSAIQSHHIPTTLPSFSLSNLFGVTLRHTKSKTTKSCVRLCSKSQDDDDDEDDDEDDEEAPAYGKRSLSWTRQYRRLLSYETARKSVMELGLRSKEEWDEYVSDGKVYHGPYLPNHPDEMYAEEWVSWDEFLGLMRPYDETRHMVQNVLCLRNMEQYYFFVNGDRKRAEGLRIPAKPHIVYSEKGWRGEDHFFGRE
mmetsp:Transcript_29831/g.39689  ORF Transcript_29831/g.39689 Transcript_29831/m.39689 type:complete len:229 (-) Transcript_29831:53-739(-)